MIRRFSALLSVSVSFAMVGCFEPGGGQDEVADASTGESESAGESESSSSSTSEESTTEESSSESSESTTESTSESTTGDPEPVCGNGVVEGDEVCDDGPMPELMPGVCAPDCSTVIEVKHVMRSGSIGSTQFANNPVAYADSTCEPGYAAMFAYGNFRVATTVPWQTVGAVDWPIRPYTAYVNIDEELLWVTDDTRLLTVRNGQKQAPVNPLFVCDPCLIGFMVSGMADDGTTLLSNTCNGWTSTDGALQFSTGSYFEFDNVTGSAACSGNFDLFPSYHFLCIEQ